MLLSPAFYCSVLNDFCHLPMSDPIDSVCDHHFQWTGYQSGIIVNPPCGQILFPAPRSPLRKRPRETGTVVWSRISLRIVDGLQSFFLRSSTVARGASSSQNRANQALQTYHRESTVSGINPRGSSLFRLSRRPINARSMFPAISCAAVVIYIRAYIRSSFHPGSPFMELP